MRTDPIGQPLEDLINHLEENRTTLSVAEPELVNRIDNLLIALKSKQMILQTTEGIQVGYAYTSYNQGVVFEKEEEDPVDSLMKTPLDVGDRL